MFERNRCSTAALLATGERNAQQPRPCCAQFMPPRDQDMKLFPEFFQEAHCKFASYQYYQFVLTAVCAKGLLAAVVKV